MSFEVSSFNDSSENETESLRRKPCEKAPSGRGLREAVGESAKISSEHLVKVCVGSFRHRG